MLYRGVCVAFICMAAHALLAAAPFPHATPMSCCLDMLPRYYGFGVGVGGLPPMAGWPESGRHPRRRHGWGKKKKKKKAWKLRNGVVYVFFWHGRAWSARNSFSNAWACRPQPHFATTTTRVGWRWVDSRGFGLPSQCFQKISSKLKTNVLLPSDLWASGESEWSR